MPKYQDAGLIDRDVWIKHGDECAIDFLEMLDRSTLHCAVVPNATMTDIKFYFFKKKVVGDPMQGWEDRLVMTKIGMDAAYHWLNGWMSGGGNGR